MAYLYHIFSNGTKADILFPQQEEKVYAINTLAIYSSICSVKVYVFVINETHFHLIVYGEEPDVENYVLHIKVRLSRYLISEKNNPLALGTGLQITKDKISDRDEGLRKFIYVYRNCLDCYSGAPWNYPWSVGNIFFNPEGSLGEGKRIGDLSLNQQRALFHIRQALPSEWRYNQDGLILPSSFIDIAAVESLFGSIRAFLAFMFVRKEDEQAMKQRIYHRQIEMRSIESLRTFASEYANKLFKKGLRICSSYEKLQIARMMIKDRVAIKSASLMRALYLKNEDVDFL